MDLLRIPHCSALTVTANEAQKAPTRGAEGAETQPVTLENVDLSTFARIFPYWFAPSAFGGKLSLEEQGMLPGVTNSSNLGKLQLHTEPTRCF